MDDSPARGRRGNGLTSADWGALVDLDPRLSEALLASLATAGVAAYVEPALGSNALTRAATLPDRPLDRLWVDATRADQARQVVGSEVADLTTLLSEQDPGATAHGLVQPVPRSAASRVLAPPPLPSPPVAATPPPSGPAGHDPDAGRPDPGRDAGPPAASDHDASQPDADDTDPAPTGPGRPAAADPLPAAPVAADAPPPDAAGPGRPDGGARLPLDPDEEFRRIVEAFGRESSSPVPPWPVSEDLDPPRGRLSSRPERSGPRSRDDRSGDDRSRNDAARADRARDEQPGDDGSGPDAAAGDATPRRRRRTDPPGPGALPDWVEPEALADEGHYVPPPPPPVPRLAPRRIAAAAALLAGLLLMFAPGLLLQDRTAFVGMVGVLLTVAGATAVVYLMRDTPPTDSGPEDGAVV